MNRKQLSIFFAMILTFLSFAHSAFSADITPITPPASNPFGNAFNMLMSNIWIVILFIAIGAGIFIFLFIWKRATKKIDPWLVSYQQTKDLCKMQKKSNLQKVIRFSSIFGIDPLGTYEGDCITKDGCINVLWSTIKFGKIGKAIKIIFFPLRPLLNLVLKDYHIFKADHLKGYVSFTNPDVIIKAVSLDKSGLFYTPVSRDLKGNIVDDRVEIFKKIRNDAMMKTMEAQVTDFVNVSRQLINVNPQVRYVVKTKGTEVEGSGE